MRAWSGLHGHTCSQGVVPTSLASTEFSLQSYNAYATTMVPPCHVEEDRTKLLTGSVGAYHFHAVDSHCVIVWSRDLGINT